MSRLRRIEKTGRFFFVTTNLQPAVPKLSPEERSLCLECVDGARAKHGFSLFAYVVMLDHVHLLVGCLDSFLPRLMRDWKSWSGYAIAKHRDQRRSIWPPRYFDFILRRAADFGEKFDYIHANPVSAGLVTRPEDWQWSSAAFYMNKTAVPVRPDLFDIPVDPNQPLWPAPRKYS